jgi:hypothetical protein
LNEPEIGLSRLTLAGAIWPDNLEKHKGLDLDRVLSDLRAALEEQGYLNLIQRGKDGAYRLILPPPDPGAPARSLPDGPPANISFDDLIRLTAFSSAGLLHRLSEIHVWCRQPVEVHIAGHVLANMRQGARYRFIMGAEDLILASSLLATLIAGSRSDPATVARPTLTSNLEILRAGLTIVITSRPSAHHYFVIVNAQDRNEAASYLQVEADRFVRECHGPKAHDAAGALQCVTGEEQRRLVEFETALPDAHLAAHAMREQITRVFTPDCAILPEVLEGIPVRKLAASCGSSLAAEERALPE